VSEVRRGEHRLRDAFGTQCPAGEDVARTGTCYCGKFRTAAAEREYGLGPGFVVAPMRTVELPAVDDEGAGK
jgi:hypothetical protein